MGAGCLSESLGIVRDEICSPVIYKYIFVTAVGIFEKAHNEVSVFIPAFESGDICDRNIACDIY